ncbi:hypothetical protein R3P38DRAFT_1319000 [Favolaschia claudopus]|uniref:Uncharacterized protein n=1 Tax=Favolaschia claudopus TaxID=2862362 RepID=A0AAW0AUY4_9AGAR
MTSTMKNATRRFAGPLGDATNTVGALTVTEPSKDRPESVSRRLRLKRLRSKCEPKPYATLRESEIPLGADDAGVASAIVDASVPPMAAIYDKVENEFTVTVVPQPSTCEEVKIHTEPTESGWTPPEDCQLSNVADVKYEPWSHLGGYTGYNDPTLVVPFEPWSSNPYYSVRLHPTPYHHQITTVPSTVRAQQTMPPPRPLSQITIPEANILIPLPSNHLLYPYSAPTLLPRLLPGPPQQKYYFHGGIRSLLPRRRALSDRRGGFLWGSVLRG